MFLKSSRLIVFLMERMTFEQVNMSLDDVTYDKMDVIYQS